MISHPFRLFVQRAAGCLLLVAALQGGTALWAQTPEAEAFRVEYGQAFRLDTLQWNGAGCIDMVLAGDGYTASEQAKLVADIRSCYDYLFRTEPFCRYASWFNLFALHVESAESGISHPGVAGPDGTRHCPEHKSLPLSTVNNFFGSALDAEGLHRLTVCSHERLALRLCRALVPTCRQVGIIANSSEYGGSGGRILVATTNAQSHEVFVHELAHSFANLADEYYAGDWYNAERPNMTHHPDTATVRWHAWLGEPEVGVFAYGRTGRRAEWFKPTVAGPDTRYCKMEQLGKEFCPVCREAIVLRIEQLCNPLRHALPADTLLPLPRRGATTFVLSGLLRGVGDSLHITWRIDGRPVAAGTDRLRLKRRRLKRVRTVQVEVQNRSPYARRREPVYRHTWHVVR